MVNERESNAALSYIKPYVIRRWVGLAVAIDLIRIQRGGKPDWERGGSLAAHMLAFTALSRAQSDQTVWITSLGHWSQLQCRNRSTSAGCGEPSSQHSHY